MKIGSINFPDELIRAIRREELVVFAGAGISMGAPAKLPNFSGLTRNIAKETGEEKPDAEPDDHFLGRLHKKGLPVHSLVGKALYTAPGSATSLHSNMLRLFKSTSKFRVVTTNFDQLFEEASTRAFGEPTAVYISPALPLGRDFTGIVHVHGSCDKPVEMVLTDADFGRAYLTEGWARRFLLDMFRKYAVLFVGYSHDDVVMHYLSRALPTEDSVRFALVADDTNIDEWLFRGIRPLPFKKPSEDDYSILDEGVRALADYVSQNLLDRRKSLVAIASGMPPFDDETVDQILDALSEESTSRFVLQAARNPAWVRWFDSRKLLDSLFGETMLTAIDKFLAEWLVDNFALEHHREIILLISRHRMNMGPWLWYLLGRKIGLNKDIKIDKLALSTWVSLLLGTMPKIADEHILLWIVERCAEVEDMNGIFTVFGKMLSHRLEVKEEVVWSDKEADDSDKTKFDVEFVSPCDHWNLNEIYTKYIKPTLNQLALPVLSISIIELEAQHSTLVSWGKSDRIWDSSSFHRSAIEPHEQDHIRHPIDVLIDATRDCLVAIGESNPALSDCWLDTFSKSDAPLVRRIFIHGLNERRDKSADDKLHFFLDRQGLHDVYAHHEIYRLIVNIYSGLSEAGRSELILLILAYEWSNREDERFEERTARGHFDWLQWLIAADPSCKIANAAMERIVAEYPDFKPKKYPDLTHWMESGRFEPRSPYTVEELLDKPAVEWVGALLAFRGDEFLGPDRDGLRMTVREAVKKNADWGLDLATALGKRSRWDIDLWAGLLQAWEEWSADKDRCLFILGWLQTKELWEHNLYQITRTLHSLVREGGKSCAATILGEANRTATVLWTEVEKDTDIPDSSDDWS
ncbi:MAG: SIR2 family protein, partial [Syntrophales bacterium]